MKYQTLIKMLMTLLAKRKVTAQQLADRYEVSVRTIYRYIEELIDADIPIDVERGRYGGISVSDTFRLPAGYFTREEYSPLSSSAYTFLLKVNPVDVPPG